MNAEQIKAREALASMGRALYGDRWQTALSADLGVSDRTMRRWVVGDSAIPSGILSELRKLLIRRIDEIGGMIGYNVNPEEQIVFHYPSHALFKYDDSGELILVSPGFVEGRDLTMIEKGAEEALRREAEREPSLRFAWLDTGGQEQGR